MDIEKLEPNRFGGMEDSEGGRFTRTRDLLAVIAERDAALSRAEAAEAERDGANRRADLFREKLTDCESALHRAEAELQGIASVSTTDWDDPSDFKGWAQSRARYALLNNRRDHHAGLCQLVIPESGGHIESADCWCGPTVEEHPGGTLIIHNQTH